MSAEDRTAAILAALIADAGIDAERAIRTARPAATFVYVEPDVRTPARVPAS